MNVRLIWILCFMVLAIPARAQGPVAAFTANVTQGCAPLVVNFNDQSTGNPQSWSWDFGIGQSTLRNPSLVFLVPGTYTVRLTVTNALGTDTETKTSYIQVYDTPTVNFVATPLQVCVGDPVLFVDQSQTGSSTSQTYLWDFGDGSAFGTLRNPTHTYTLAGPKTVTLRVTNQWGCSRTRTRSQYIQVDTSAWADFTADKTILCDADTVQFTSSVQGNPPHTYSWTFGSLGNSTQAHPRFGFPSTPGSHTVSLAVTDSRGCVRTVVKPNFIERIQVSASINSPATACEGAMVSFSANTQPAGATTLWNFGDGSPWQGASSPSHSYSSAGTYEVTLVAIKDGCGDTVKKSIQILPRPKADFTINPTYPCTIPATIQFSPVGNFSSYHWDFGVNPTATSTLRNPSHTYTAGGLYSPRLLVTAANGCQDSVTKYNGVQLHSGRAVVSASSEGGCLPLFVNFMTHLYSDLPIPSSPYPVGVSSYSWDFGDGYTGSGASPYHVFQDTGRFMVQLSATTQNGCVFRDSIEVKVGLPPTVDFNVVPTQACVRSTLDFINLSSGADSFLWDFGDGKYATLKDPHHEYGYPGLYDVRLIAFHNLCPDTQIYKKLVQIDSPRARFEFEVSCDTVTKVSFASTSIGETSFLWIFGDNTLDSQNKNPVHYYPAEGNYLVRLVAYNSQSGCSDTEKLNLSLRMPVTTITASDTAVCNEVPLSFVGQRTPAGVEFDKRWSVNGVWDPLDIYSTFSWTPDEAGMYTVSYSYTDAFGCRRGTQLLIRVSEPEVDFSADSVAGCNPLPVQFTDLSVPSVGSQLTQWTWDFGDGSPFSTTRHAQHTYQQTGFFDVRLTVTDDLGCTAEKERQSYIVVERQIPEFEVDSVVCLGEEAVFTPLSFGQPPYFWDFGDGSTSTNPNPRHLYQDTGWYTIQLAMANRFGCMDTVEITDRIRVQAPQADFSLSGTLSACLPFPVTMTNLSTRSNKWFWDFGNGVRQVHNNLFTPVNIMYLAPGNYNVTLIAEDILGCRDTVQKTVNVLGYDGSLDYSPLTGCAPLEVHFTNQVFGVASLQYDFDDGVVISTQAGQPYTHTYRQPGRYRPRLVITDSSGCSTGSEGKKDILVDGVDVGFDHSPACVGQEIEFQDRSYSSFSNKVSWSWTINGQSSHQPQAKARFNQPGFYDLKLVVTNANGCLDSVIDRFEVHALPIIDAGEDTLVCIGDYAQLEARGGRDYRWTPADPLSCTDCPDPLARPELPTEFTVIGTDQHGCSDTDKVMVSLKTHVEAGAEGDGEICLGERRRLMAWGADQYHWSPAESLSQAEGDTTLAQPATTTRYRMVATEGSCIPDTHFLQVVVHPLPEVQASGSTRIIAGEEVPIQAQGRDIDRFLWSPSATLSCDDCASPMARPLKTTRYTVIVFNDFGCMDSSSVNIDVVCDQSQVFLPNTFTPNGDGQNDIFYPRGAGLSHAGLFRIYNRWGELIFERRNIAFNDALAGWDGRFQGQELGPDVFVWFLEVECESGEQLLLKGDISLIR